MSNIISQVLRQSWYNSTLKLTMNIGYALLPEKWTSKYLKSGTASFQITPVDFKLTC